MRGKDGGFRRDHLRALAQRVEVAEREVRIMGSRNELFRVLASANSRNGSERRSHVCSEVAEGKGFEPSIGLYDPITV